MHRIALHRIASSSQGGTGGAKSAQIRHGSRRGRLWSARHRLEELPPPCLTALTSLVAPASVSLLAPARTHSGGRRRQWWPRMRPAGRDRVFPGWWKRRAFGLLSSADGRPTALTPRPIGLEMTPFVAHEPCRKQERQTPIYCPSPAAVLWPRLCVISGELRSGEGDSGWRPGGRGPGAGANRYAGGDHVACHFVREDLE
ncbi:hypothetical protein B0T25DRAFT_28911 [Lasiosphaeria hispida]|uniref:Uncharacterized protein n=1 Tax=Lasiosphaeria hispida TaxID=260671 RepID=A0AAJ0MJR8_9PEZI|nr:hypothetical protein B0T25DRAFT_28911 [Lasiosphaeria hispida]